MKPPLEAVYQSVAARIRLIRETLGMTQEELATRTGLTRTSIVNIEAGRQRFMLHDMEAMARALNISPKHLMKGIWW